MQFFASCPPGVADLTAAELQACGATRTRELRLGVQFEGTLEVAYRACLWSRTASRILMPLASFPAPSAEALYAGVKQIDWPAHLGPRATLAVELAGTTPGVTHTHFGALKTKDAIVDRLREARGERPSIEVERPSVRVDVRLDRERATVSLDFSGESLHRRAYRARGVAAPLKENLAAAILLRCGWPSLAAQGAALLDPLCGSGTLVIEAALMALDIAPGSLRSYFGFLGWAGHDRALWARLLDEAQTRRAAGEQRKLTLRGYDRDASAVRAAQENVERAKLRGRVHIERRELEALGNEGLGSLGLLVTNPPYGERIGDQAQLERLYATLGEKLREHFVGWKAAVFTGNPPFAKALGIHARRTHTLYNGKIECRLLRFDVDAAQFMRQRTADASERDAAIRARPGAQMFANRLRKNLKAARDWAQREGIDCYRLYDADMPEYAFAIDCYGDGDTQRWAYVQEYAPPRTVDQDAARMRRREVLASVPEVLGLPRERIFLRERRQQKGLSQYEKVAAQREFHIVRENGYRFLVNFQDYLDTGLFLDHRLTRQRIGEMAKGKRFLNLFAYTGTATVYAAGGGAASTTTVDMSRTYTEWAKRNLALNELADPRHEFVQADVLTWLEVQGLEARGLAGQPWEHGRPGTIGRESHAAAAALATRASVRRYDLMFIDPPTHSRSKRLEDDFDVQRDHPKLLRLAADMLAPNGQIVFSNNYTRFKLDPQIADIFQIEDWSERTIPWDFRRNPRIHRCYLLSLRRT